MDAATELIAGFSVVGLLLVSRNTTGFPALPGEGQGRHHPCSTAQKGGLWWPRLVSKVSDRRGTGSSCPHLKLQVLLPASPQQQELR